MLTVERDVLDELTVLEIIAKTFRCHLTGRYFTLFMKLLNECSDELEGGKEKGQVTGLRNITVQAMSNLLSANIDSGLMHSISEYWLGI